MLAMDVMTNDPHAVSVSSTVRAAALMMKEHDVGILPVVNNATARRLEGVITDRDITVRFVAEGRPQDDFVVACMSRSGLVTATPEARVEEVLRLMERARVRRIPVVNADRRLVGIIALADIVRALGRERPQAVAELLERVCDAPHALA